MAMRDSVTVSMSEEITGMERRRLSDRRVDVSASLGRICEYNVASETSSKVRAVGALARKNESAGR